MVHLCVVDLFLQWLVMQIMIEHKGVTTGQRAPGVTERDTVCIIMGGTSIGQCIH